MNDYLKDEVTVLRSVAWHVLLLCLIGVLVRSAGSREDPSAIGGIPFQVNNVLFVLAAPLYALIVQFIAYVENTNLFATRASLRDELKTFAPLFRVQVCGAIILFTLPALLSLFFITQFFTMVAPMGTGCTVDPFVSHFSQSYAGPSIYCLRDVTEGNPWIYLPAYDFALLLVGAGCVALCGASIWRWLSGRNYKPLSRKVDSME